MDFRSLSSALVVFAACFSTAHAQLAATLKISKNQHLAGESVMATVTVTNHAGRELVFKSDGRIQWLNLVVRDGRGNPVNPRGNYIFGPMKIAAGQTLSREVDLSQHFQLSRPGNFTVAAVVNSPIPGTDGTTTNRVFFNQSSGTLYWSQKVGLLRNPSHTREFRVLNFSGDSKSLIYAQVQDNVTGDPVHTFPLGEVLMMRKPSATVDRNQRMHVLFLTTPSLWVHSVVDSDGRLVSRKIHQSPPQGNPQLLTFPDGSVSVANSIPYDAKAQSEERAKVRKASDRPSIGL